MSKFASPDRVITAERMELARAARARPRWRLTCPACGQEVTLYTEHGEGSCSGRPGSRHGERMMRREAI